MDKTSRIYVAGHRGLVGSAIVRRLKQDGYTNLLTPAREELDLIEPRAVDQFFMDERPDYVFLAAARVGGIVANLTWPAEFIYDNLLIQINTIDAAAQFGAKKLLFLGSSCIYPANAPQPIREESLLTGPLEPSNSAYAIAKIAGIEMCRAYRQQWGLKAICLMPTNLYGPGDNFDSETGHVIPALIAKFHEGMLAKAPEVRIWGDGTARREFLYVDDLADAAVFLMQSYESAEPINVGTGQDITIRELAGIIASVVGYTGDLGYDMNRPTGVRQKRLDVSRLWGLGWRCTLSLDIGIRRTYAWYQEHVAGVAAR